MLYFAIEESRICWYCIFFSKIFEKNVKNPLTKRNRCAIIIKRSRERSQNRNVWESGWKNFLRNFEKPLDKCEKMWYNKQVAARERTTSDLENWTTIRQTKTVKNSDVQRVREDFERNHSWTVLIDS